MTIEQRHCSHDVNVETRTKDGDTVHTLTGYAAVYYREGDAATEFRMFDDLVERIMPGALSAMAREDDVRALVNHDPNKLLGRTTSGTLRLFDDDIGLRYEIDVADTQSRRDAIESVKRRDMTGSSFAFLTSGGKRGKVVWSEEGNQDVREIHNLEGFDVGPVTYPAYTGTTSEARDLISAERDAARRLRDGRSRERRLSIDRRVQAVRARVSSFPK